MCLSVTSEEARVGHRPAPDLELFWGKSSSGGAAWLPVLAHLRDTASVIGHVADTLVPAGRP